MSIQAAGNTTYNNTTALPIATQHASSSQGANNASPLARMISTSNDHIWSAQSAQASQVQSPMQKLIGGIKMALEMSSVLQQQLSLDRQSGQGIISGAQEFGSNVVSTIELLDQLRGVNSAEDIGAIGQNLVLNQFKQELLSTAAQQFGLDASQLSVEGVGEMAWNYATTGSINGAAGSALGQESASLGSASLEGGAFSTGGKLLGAAGAAYAGYELVKNWGRSSPQMGAIQGATVGAYIGSVVPGVGTLIGGAVGAVVGGIAGCIHTGKSKDQQSRDAVRKGLQEIGLLDKQWKIQLADGSGYDMGKDGGFKLTNMDGSSRRAYEVDFRNPLAGDVVAKLTPLASALCGGDEKLTNQFTAYLTNAALSNATDMQSAMANVERFYQNTNALAR